MWSGVSTSKPIANQSKSIVMGSKSGLVNIVIYQEQVLAKDTRGEHAMEVHILSTGVKHMYHRDA